MSRLKRFLMGTSLGLIVLVSVLGGAISDRAFGFRVLDKFFPKQAVLPGERIVEKQILTEESVVTDVVEKVGPSVVTVSIKKTQTILNPFEDFWDPFGFFGFRQPQQPQQREQKIEQDIGSGFIISKDGLVVTNKHVVNDTEAAYKVITKDNKEYEVKKIYRDPVNDMAILKIDPSTNSGQAFQPVEMGDSSKLKVGQFVIAIGTALGEFRNTVTTGVISGLGRGITAGTAFEGYAEHLDNVIQTDAAINPGNSGGPLLNSAGQVIGVSVAVASGAQNIGFALPINIVKDSIENFNKTGQFSRPFLGVRYRMISQAEAVSRGWAEGAGVVEVVSGSPADKAGIKIGDILTKFDGTPILEKDGGLAALIAKKKIGDQLKLTVWREGKEMEFAVTLEEFS
ncbi:trypsin-like serine protease [Candidatus Shapirobacteria bacterium]|nr:trypsin-like serine protease [Candidatus Shapirobacteria bacterium]